jgi:hypothetical protein
LYFTCYFKHYRSQIINFITNQNRKDNIEEYYIGEMNDICIICRAVNFVKEKPKDKEYSHCCNKGNDKLLNLSDIKESPAFLSDLVSGRHSQ